MGNGRKVGGRERGAGWVGGRWEEGGWEGEGSSEGRKERKGLVRRFTNGF